MWNRNHSFVIFLIFFSALNCISVENFSFFGTTAIWLSLLFLGSLNPYLSMQALVASQTLATPLDLPVTHTQIFLLIWFVVNIVRLRRINLQSEIVALAPFLGVVVVVSVLKGSFSGLVFSASVFAVVYMTYACYRKSTSDLSVLSNLMLGSFTAAMPFLMSFVGISYYRDVRQLSIMIAERGGLKRFAAGLGDFNYIGACILVAFAIAITYLTYYLLLKQTKIPLYQKTVFLGIACAAPFSAIGTLSRSAIVGIPFTLIVVSGFVFREGAVFSRWLKALFALTVCSIGTYFIFEDFWTKYFDAIFGLNFSGKGHDLSRFSLALPHLRAMFDNPILGGEVATIRGIKFEAHNTFVEMGSTYGLLGALAFLYCVLVKPLGNLRLLVNRHNTTFYIAYIICLYSMFWLSIGGWKIFWLLWTILIAQHEKMNDMWISTRGKYG